MGALLANPFILSLLTQLAAPGTMEGLLKGLIEALRSSADQRRKEPYEAVIALVDVIPEGKEQEAVQALQQALEGLGKWKHLIQPVVTEQADKARTVFESAADRR